MSTGQKFSTTVMLGLAVLALTTAVGATEYECQDKKFKIRYYASDVDTYHNKRVIAYCDHNYKPISCEAEIFTSSDYPSEASKYFVALNEVHPYKNGDHTDSHGNENPYYKREGCWARANTFYANYDNFHGDPYWDNYSDTDFYWGLKVYATCVPKHCVKKSAGDGSYEWYAHEPSEPEPHAVE
jgi:hypothetical protein